MNNGVSMALTGSAVDGRESRLPTGAGPLLSLHRRGRNFRLFAKAR